MATVVEPRLSSHSPEPAPVVAPKRSRRWLYATLAVLGVLALLAWFAPAIVARTSYGQQAVAMTLPGIDGTLTAERLSLGWFSPIVCENVQLRDKEGEPLAVIARVTSERTLWDLATDSAHLGRFEFTEPQITIVVRAEGSNAEDVLLPWWNAPGSGNTDAHFVIHGGKVQIHDVTANRTHQIDSLELDVLLDESSPLPAKLDVSGRVVDARPGTFNLRYQAPTDVGGKPSGPRLVSLKTEALPLDLASPALARLDPRTAVGGRLSSELQLTWDEGAAAAQHLSGQATVEQLSVVAPDWLREEIRLVQLRGLCQLERRGTEVRIGQLSVDSDVGRFAAQGAGIVDDRSALELLGTWNYTLGAQVDLARLAALAPRTLHVREGTQITRGTIQMALAAPDGNSWTGKIETANLAAQVDGRQFEWQKPVLVDWVVQRQTDGSLKVQNVRCDSSFLQLQGSGSLGEFAAQAQFDLAKLQAELAQFVDVGELRLAGSGEANVRASRDTTGGIRAEAQGEVQNFSLAGAGSRPWNEPKLTLGVVAQGATGAEGIERLDSATFSMAAGSDRLDARLLEAVAKPSAASRWPLEVSVQGELAQWMPRLEAFLPASSLQVAGVTDLSATLVYSPEEIVLQQSKLHVQRPRLEGAGIRLDEPELRAEATGRWNSLANRLELGRTNFASNTFSLSTDRASLGWNEAGVPSLEGVVDYQGDLERLSRLLADPQTAAWRPVGQVSGRAEFTHAAGITNGRLTSLIEQLAVYPAGASASATPVWQEPRLQLAATGRLDQAADALRLDQFEVQAQALQVKAAGQMERLSTVRDTTLQGEMTYDMAVMSQLLKPYLGESLFMTGRETRPFTVRGPLDATWIERLTANASVGWATAKVYGLPLGPGTIDARLNQGVVILKPLEMDVAEGKFRIQPRLRLKVTPYDVILEPGTLLEQVRLSPDMCASALKFVAPVLSEATRTDGKFSVQLAGGRIPLDDPQAADVGGRLTIHSVEVTPGPLTDSLLLIGKQVEALLEKRVPPTANDRQSTLLRLAEQNVEFRLVERRVHHAGLTMQAGKVTIRTRGSVGLDESLQLIAEVPIRDEWTQKDPILAGLRGQVLQIPIEGSLRKPRVDARVIQNVGNQILRSAAGSLLQDQLNKQFDKLLPPRQQ